MLNRWIIVGEPRCGSHWLESMLPPKLALDEFFNHYCYNAHRDYTFDDDNLMNVIFNPPTDVLTTSEFVQKRISQIKKIIPTQPVKGILFCNNPRIDYPPIIKVLDEYKFNFIIIERNLFDRVLSSCAVNITNFAHRWYFDKKAPLPDSLGKINIDPEVWTNTLFKEYQTTEHRKTLFSDYNVLTVRYENLIEDCQINKIPIIREKLLSKTWNVEYKDVVINITELQEIYKSFMKSAVPDYSQYHLKYA